MHIPDNFLSTPVWACLDAVAIPAVAIVSRQAHRATDSNRLPLLGVMGAFVFAAQMINFPVGLGTSGHLVGGTLLACPFRTVGGSTGGNGDPDCSSAHLPRWRSSGTRSEYHQHGAAGGARRILPARSFSGTRWSSFGTFLGGTCSVLVSGVLALSELLLSGIRMPSTLIGVSLALFAVNAVLEGAYGFCFQRSGS